MLRGTAIIPAKEFLLNLHRDLIQPFLGPIRPVLVTPDLYLKLSYPIFGRSKLTDSLRASFHGLLIICLGSIGRLANHFQNQVARLLKRIAVSGLPFTLGAKERLHLVRPHYDCSRNSPHMWPHGPEQIPTHPPSSRSPVDNS